MTCLRSYNGLVVEAGLSQMYEVTQHSHLCFNSHCTWMQSFAVILVPLCDFSFSWWCVCVCIFWLIFIFFFFFWPCRVACGILVPWPGIKPVPPAVEVWSPNHWTAREVPRFLFLKEIPVFSISCIFLLNLISLSYTWLASLKAIVSPHFQSSCKGILQSEGQMPGNKDI